MAKVMIETVSDAHVESARIQQEIKDYLGLRTSDLIFEYGMQDGKVKLDLITINPRHNQSFLFHSEQGADKVDSLKKMLDYVQNYKEKENSYTIQWVAKPEQELHTSYFRASNILEALEKSGKRDNTIIVFSSDNGLAMGSHGLMGKQNIYDHSVHMPLIIAGPGIPKGETRAIAYPQAMATKPAIDAAVYAPFQALAPMLAICRVRQPSARTRTLCVPRNSSRPRTSSSMKLAPG